jgi:2,4-dienoyl-CoA reductase-like NADH-dependent reductase (Old Yellow Enzyme family)
MSILFDSYKLKHLSLNNRFIRSATTSYWSDKEGILRGNIIDYYKQLAKGGVGLIIKGHSYVSLDGKAHTGQSGLSSEKHLPMMKKLVQIVHQNDSNILAQLNHAGYNSIHNKITASDYNYGKIKGKKATIEEITQIINNFRISSELAIEAGFDGVQIHAAHGFLISQFLSNKVNNRNDIYGGNLENRMRLLLEVYNSIKNSIGKEKIIGVKINTDDFAKDGGFQVQDCIKVIEALKIEGIDFVELSGGGPESSKTIRKTRGKTSEKHPLSETYWGAHAMKVREVHPNIPLALVGGIRSKETMDYLLENNISDFISLSRPLIIEPDFPNQIKNGQQKSVCNNCSRCSSKEVFGKQMLQCEKIA